MGKEYCTKESYMKTFSLECFRYLSYAHLKGDYLNMKIFIWGMGAESERLYFPEDIEIIGKIINL